MSRVAAAAAALALTVGTLAGAPAASAAPSAAASAVTVSSDVASYYANIHTDASTVYYPTTGTGKLPVALLLQGADVDRDEYATYARTVASYGFVVVVPNHWRLVFVDYGLFSHQGQAIQTAIWAHVENANPFSPLRNRIDTESFTLLGHSFGAATGLYTVQGNCQIPFCWLGGNQRPKELKAAAFYGANTVDPSGDGGIDPINTAGIPVALIQGSVDGVSTPAEAQGTYNAFSGGPASLITVNGANHYGLTDSPAPSGAEPDPSAQVLPQQVSIETAARWSALYLRAQLGDAAAAAYVYGHGDAADSNVTVQHRP